MLNLKEEMELLDEVGINQAVNEIRNNLREIESKIIDHVLNDGIEPYLEELMRRMHTIKGVAAGCGFKKIMRIAHDRERELRSLGTPKTASKTIPYARICDELLDAIYQIQANLSEADSKSATVERDEQREEVLFTYLCFVDSAVATLDLAEIEVLEVFSQFGIEYADYRAERCADRYCVEVDVPQAIRHQELLECIRSKDIIIGINQKQDLQSDTLEDTKTPASSDASIPESDEPIPHVPKNDKEDIRDLNSGNHDLTTTSEIENKKTSALLNDFIFFEQNLYTVHNTITKQHVLLKNILSQLDAVEEGLLPSNANLESLPSFDRSDFYNDLIKTIKAMVYNNEFTQFNVLQQNMLFLSRLKQALVTEQMVDLKSIFQWFGTYLYTVSKELGKLIRYKYEDQGLSIDKQLLGSVSTLLLHCIRNSLDHGIENSDLRLKLGKPKEAEISVVAEELSNMIKIDVCDDGAGLDVKGIQEKGIALGLLDKDAHYSDEAIIDLIFLPQFTTREEHTILSGFGMGLSALREGIQKIGGIVSVSFEKNRFTKFTIIIPSSLNLHSDYIVSENGFYFAIPTFHVKTIQHSSNTKNHDHPTLRELLGANKASVQKNIAVCVDSDVSQNTFFVEQLIGLHTVTVFPVLFPVSTQIQALARTTSGDICFVLYSKRLFSKEESTYSGAQSFFNTLGPVPDLAAKDLPMQTVLECRLHSLRIGFPTSLISEACVPTSLHEVPVKIPYIIGIALVRGRPIPVWDIRMLIASDATAIDSKNGAPNDSPMTVLFGIGQTKSIVIVQFSKYSIGILIDEVIGTRKIHQNDLLSPRGIHTVQHHSSLIDIVKQSDASRDPMLVLHPLHCILSILWRCAKKHV